MIGINSIINVRVRSIEIYNKDIPLLSIYNNVDCKDISIFYYTSISVIIVICTINENYIGK